MSEEVVLHIGEKRFEFTFKVIEGEGDFLGHICFGNRPSQLLNKGVNRFEAFDLQLFLRTITRTPQCKIQVVIYEIPSDS